MYWALKKEEILNMTIFVLFPFLQLCNIRGTYSKCFQNNISETVISSAPELPDVIFQEFHIHSTYEIHLCIWNNFNVLISKTVGNLS